MSTAEIASDIRIGLPADLGIERLAELRAQLAPTFEMTVLRIDGSAISRVHGATLQLLAAFCRDRTAAGHVTHWQSPSTVLRDAARQLALTPHLQIEEN
ncbi:MAG TPA: hypothetical protein VIR56_17385 [Solimonas sp.]